jgi:hypothetical protein
MTQRLVTADSGLTKSTQSPSTAGRLSGFGLLIRGGLHGRRNKYNCCYKLGAFHSRQFLSFHYIAVQFAWIICEDHYTKSNTQPHTEELFTAG